MLEVERDERISGCGEFPVGSSQFSVWRWSQSGHETDQSSWGLCSLCSALLWEQPAWWGRPAARTWPSMWRILSQSSTCSREQGSDSTRKLDSLEPDLNTSKAELFRKYFWSKSDSDPLKVTKKPLSNSRFWITYREKLNSFDVTSDFLNWQYL